MDPSRSPLASSASHYSELNDLDNSDIELLIKQLEYQVEIIKTENELLEHYFNDVVPTEFKPKKASAQAPRTITRESSIFRSIKSSNQSKVIEKSQTLTIANKCEIIQNEIEILTDEMTAEETEFHKQMDNYEALAEEADISLIETRKDKYEFEREIVHGAFNHKTKVCIAEKCISHFQHRLKYRDNYIEKMRIKLSTMKVNRKKLMHQLKLKAELGEVLCLVDYDQLKILNQQYLQTIEERNQDLLRLKLMAGEQLQLLNSLKRRLLNLTKESKKLQSEIDLRTDLQRKIESERSMAESERIQADHLNKRLHTNLLNYHVPEVMDYVLETADLYTLGKNIKIWERKVYNAEMAYKGQVKVWNKLKAGAKMLDYWRKVGKTV